MDVVICCPKFLHSQSLASLIKSEFRDRVEEVTAFEPRFVDKIPSRCGLNDVVIICPDLVPADTSKNFYIELRKKRCSVIHLFSSSLSAANRMSTYAKVHLSDQDPLDIFLRGVDAAVKSNLQQFCSPNLNSAPMQQRDLIKAHFPELSKRHLKLLPYINMSSKEASHYVGLAPTTIDQYRFEMAKLLGMDVKSIGMKAYQHGFIYESNDL